jgi:transposase-like protein
MPKRYPVEFRRRVLDLVRSGRPVVEIANELGIGQQTVYNWRRQERIDRGEIAGVSSTDHAELTAARRQIAQLEAELAAMRRAAELLADVVPPKGSSRRSPR